MEDEGFVTRVLGSASSAKAPASSLTSSWRMETNPPFLQLSACLTLNPEPQPSQCWGKSSTFRLRQIRALSTNSCQDKRVSPRTSGRTVSQLPFLSLRSYHLRSSLGAAALSLSTRRSPHADRACCSQLLLAAQERRHHTLATTDRGLAHLRHTLHRIAEVHATFYLTPWPSKRRRVGVSSPDWMYSKAG